MQNPVDNLEEIERRRRRGGRPRLWTLHAAGVRHLKLKREHDEHPARPETLAGTASRLHVLEDAFGQTCLLSQLTFEEVKSFVLEKRKTHKSSSINQYLQTLTAVLRESVEAGDIPASALAIQIRKLYKKIPRRNPDTLTAAEVDLLIAKAAEIDERVALALRIAVEFGFRIGEVRHLEIAQIDFNRRIVRMDDTPDVEWLVKTDAGHRSVPMTDKAEDALQKYLKAYPELLEGRWLFPSNRKRNYPLSKTVFKKRIAEAFKAAGLYGRQLPGAHMMRRTWATALVAGGCDVKTLQNLAGWEKLETAEKYLHCTEDMKREAVDRMEAKREAKASPAATPATTINLADMDRLIARGLSADDALAFLREQAKRG